MRDSLKTKQSASLEAGRVAGGRGAGLPRQRSRPAEPFSRHFRPRPAQSAHRRRRPGFLAAVLDYLAGDEPLLLAFAADAGVQPEAVARAHAALRGPGEG